MEKDDDNYDEHAELGDTSGDDYSSSDEGETRGDQFPDGADRESEQESGLELTPLKIATATCLHKYAIVRMQGAESGLLPWPPLMLVVLDYLNKFYKRRELVTERNIAMLELLLKVPIQAYIRRTEGADVENLKQGEGGSIVDLNDDASLDYTGMSFVESLEILRDLLEKDVIKKEQTRVSESMFVSG